jgi:hypothetical protein
MIADKLGPFWTNRFEVIAILVNFNLRGAEAKLGLKFGDIRLRRFGVIEFLVFFFQNGGRRPSWISKFKILMTFSYSGSLADDS